MNSNLINVLKKLIEIKSVHGNDQELAKALDLAIKQVPEFTIEHFEKKGSKSVLIYNTPSRPKKFKVILNGHLDIIPGKENQYKPMIENQKLYGVGAMDMKASIVCLLSVFNDVARLVDYPLGLQLVTDEEVGGFNGTLHQIEEGVKSEFVIAAEPTNFNIVHQAKGILCIKVTAHGTSAHSAYPWRGVNAIEEMNAFLQKLKKSFPTLRKEAWVSTLNIAKVETSNSAFNKIPDDCTAWLDIRFIPQDSSQILEKVTSLIPASFTWQVEVNESALFVDPTNPNIQQLQKITQTVYGKKIKLYGAHGSSDARHYTKVGINGIEFGPVGANIGADNEWVDLKSLDIYCEALKKFLLKSR
jgi:succinyl-diaminopimelate desuccinylase